MRTCDTEMAYFSRNILENAKCQQIMFFPTMYILWDFEKEDSKSTNKICILLPDLIDAIHHKQNWPQLNTDNTFNKVSCRRHRACGYTVMDKKLLRQGN